MKMSALDELLNRNTWCESINGTAWVERSITKTNFANAQQELSALRSEIERLKAEREWQPIKTFDKSTENENIDYLFLEKGVISIGFRYPDGFTDTLAVDVLWPDHYMKLPQPPEEK